MHGFYADLAEKVIRFDLVVDFEVRNRAAYFKGVVDEVAALFPGYRFITTMDADYSD